MSFLFEMLSSICTVEAFGTQTQKKTLFLVALAKLALKN